MDRIFKKVECCGPKCQLDLYHTPKVKDMYKVVPDTINTCVAYSLDGIVWTLPSDWIALNNRPYCPKCYKEMKQ